MWRSPWFKLSMLVTVLGVAALGWVFRSKPEVQVSTALVTDGPMTRRVIATGSLQAVTTVEVGSQVSGIVQSLLVDYNSFVHEGVSSRGAIRRSTMRSSRRHRRRWRSRKPGWRRRMRT